MSSRAPDTTAPAGRAVDSAARSGSPVRITRVAGRRDRDRFIRFPWRIYRDDPQWVPPLIMDVRAVLSLRHPFHRHAEVECFLAWRDGHVVGRIAAIVNRAHVDFHGEQAGFFGLFESIDDPDVARALLSTAAAWLAERGMEAMRGPMNLSTNDELYSPGVLIDGFDTPPTIMMAHTPPYYAALLESAGFTKAKDLVAYWIPGPEGAERLARRLERVQASAGIRIRSIDLKDFRGEVGRVLDVYNSAWERNWAFVPMAQEEITHRAKQLRPVVNPQLCVIAEVGDEPVGFALALPDYNIALRHVDGRLFPFGLLKLLWYRRQIDAARVITLGLRPGYRHKGLDAMMIMHLMREGPKAGYAQGECSWILEDNWEMRRGIERVGGYPYKTYRVFEKPLRP